MRLKQAILATLILAVAGFSAPVAAQGPGPRASAPPAQAQPRARQPDRVLRLQDAAARRAARIERMFRLADRNRDGFLSRAEYQQWYRDAARRRGPLTWRKHAAQLFRQLDVGRDGRLTRLEFAGDPSFRRTRPGWGAAARAPADKSAADHVGSPVADDD